MEISEILTNERKKNKLTQQQVADYLKIARGSYAKYETGANTPTIFTFKKLAELYKCQIDYLAGRYKED